LNTKNLIEFLQEKDTIRQSWSIDYVNTSLETNPMSYLNFANEDLESSFDHKYINAISNTKRALDGQADRVMKLLGVKQQKTIGFHKKLEFLQKVDILAPRILQKINRVRNLVEHEYLKPNPEQVEDFFDIVSLFVLSTERYVSHTVRTVEYNNEESEKFGIHYYVEILIDNDNSQLLINISNFKYGHTPQKMVVNVRDEDYFEILKYHFKKAEFR